MANNVFANNREISCKSGAGQTICAFPDTCFTPPENPATPPGVPIPYPNTGKDSDTTEGTKNVKISGKEIMLKNKSYFKTSYGDEAGCAAKKGVITSVNRGKVYFTAWSMDVKFEGENVVRHLDLTTHNHASSPGNSPPWAFTDSMGINPIEECKTETKNKKEACEDKGLNTRDEQCNDADCSKARKCLLVTKSQGDRDSASTKVGCCGSETPHHLVEGHGLQAPGGGTLSKYPKYVYDDAPCVCADGDRWSSEHGAFHQSVGKKETAAVRAAKTAAKREFAWTYKEAKNAAINAHQKIFAAGCSKKCLEAQLDAYHNSVGCHDHNTLRTYDVEAAGHI